ncbi:hypothetical protein BR63_13270 [Thermanaerosceptrum fracticalcis]|uniref:DUF1468 domain-containing protein n=1 Tax=Thermanaerosceptrum fracticalcis TaxID=1712410 RepID=A0A7G6E532_THEFR|nr:tripartite tricarboxylate transporter TctB family protein [Thermanaerosceptrum fracticalcis]QNB47186.1 hypothetical protein BR63_13270 [Thermanaerosceptrum fracticalcis]
MDSAKSEKWFALALLLICLIYLFTSLSIPTGTVSKPGPGFFPIILGLIGTLLAVGVTINGFKSSKHEKVNQDSYQERLQQDNIKRIIQYIMILTISILTFKILGAILTVFFLTIVLARICGQQGWIIPVIMGIVCASCLHFIFVKFFSIPLPEGLMRLVI